MGTIGIILIATGVVGLLTGIILAAVFLPARNRGKYTGAAKWFYDFLNFNKYWISSIVKVIFIILTVMGVLGGLIILFIEPMIGLPMILGTIGLRLLFEMMVLFISMRDNLAQINDTLSAKLRGDENAAPGNTAGAVVPPAPREPITPTPAPPAAPKAPQGTRKCANCGKVSGRENDYCPGCGNPI